MQRENLFYETLRFLDAAIIHAAANFSNESRIFLCLDYQFSNSYRPEDIFKNKDIYNTKLTPFTVPLKDIDSSFEDELISTLSKIISKNNFKDIVFLLSTLHFEKNVSIKHCYDWLVEISKRSNDGSLYEKAIHLRKYLVENRSLNERFSWEKWEESTKMNV